MPRLHTEREVAQRVTAGYRAWVGITGKSARGVYTYFQCIFQALLRCVPEASIR